MDLIQFNKEFCFKTLFAILTLQYLNSTSEN